MEAFQQFTIDLMPVMSVRNGQFLKMSRIEIYSTEAYLDAEIDHLMSLKELFYLNPFNHFDNDLYTKGSLEIDDVEQADTNRNPFRLL